jgi:hypothetical protein
MDRTAPRVLGLGENCAERAQEEARSAHNRRSQTLTHKSPGHLEKSNYHNGPTQKNGADVHTDDKIYITAGLELF